MKNLQPTTYNPQPSRGFTLVEMLVSISVFMVVMTVATGSLMSVIDANNKAQALKSAINNLNFAIESMAKEIRVGTGYSGGTECSVKDTKDTCIKFTSYKSILTVYKYNNSDGGFIERCQGASCNFSTGTFIRMTALGVKIDGLKFYIVGTDPARVLITISGEAGTKTKLKTKFNLQTTVSQRSF